MGRVVTFGEIMMRLNPPGYLRLKQTKNFEVSFAGGEANVAVAVAGYGTEAAFVTKLPDNELGKTVVNELRRYGVRTDNIVFGGPRLGIFLVEKGFSQRPSTVLYDRAYSSIALAEQSDFDWDKIFEGADWFHFTGITPALGGNLPDICLDACQAAKEKGLTVSVDINYRKKLWTKEAAGNTLEKLMPYVDLCISNEEDAGVFGIVAENSDFEQGKIHEESYISVAKQLVERFGFKKVAITLRGSISASENDWAGMLYDGNNVFLSPKYNIKLVDRIGGGDSFGGALIHALKTGYTNQDAINFAVAASCLQQTIEGDFSLTTVQEVQSLAAGNTTGRVQR